MPGKYKWVPLKNCDINDNFFDSLKEDYIDFEKWFDKKSKEDKKAFVYYDHNGIGAFVMLKPGEQEVISLKEGNLPKKSRLKISTLKLSDRVQGNRMGEGAIGLALWRWLESDDNEIYVTVFPKHTKLIEMLKKFGFKIIGHNINNECVLIRSKDIIDYSTPYTSFPFINKAQDKIAILPIEAKWHDTLFPYSELLHTKQECEEKAAANGITKTYICFSNQKPIYKSNQPILIYRITDNGPRKYKSVVTSYGTIVNFRTIKENYKALYTYEEYINIVGNKSVFSKYEIDKFYNKKNLHILEIVYNHAFGKGNNVNYDTLCSNGIWKSCYPYQAEYSMSDFEKILYWAKQDPTKLIK